MEKNKSGVQHLAPEYEFVNRSGFAPVKQEGSFAQRVAVATYDVAVDGGGAGTHGTGVYLPDNAVVTNVVIDVVTTFTDGGDDDATIAVQIQSANDVVAAIAISNASNVWDAGLRASKIGNFALDGNALTQIAMAAARAAAWLKLTAEREIAVVTATDTLTAGKMNIYVEYFIGD